MAAALLSGVPSANAQLVSSVEDLTNDKCFAINRLGDASGAVYAQDGSVVYKSGSNREDVARWTFYYDKDLDQHYMYNIGAGKFVTGKNGVAVLTDTPEPVKLLYIEKGTSKGFRITFENNSNVLGLVPGMAGTNILLESDSCTVSDGFFMRVSKGRDLTAEEQKAIADKIDPKAIREAVISQYRQFVTQAKAMDEDGHATYAGGYDVKALEDALGDASYTLADLKVLYNQALESRLPKAGHYYRIKNTTRMTKNAHTNVLGALDGFTAFNVRTLSTVRPGAGSDYAENLSLFLFDGNDGLVTVRMAAAPRSFGDSGSANRVGLNPSDEGHTYILESMGDWSREFRLRNSTRSTWLTANGSGELHNYGIAEDPMKWWFEEITAIDYIVISKNGYGSFTLPCPVQLPEGVEAYIISQVTNDKIVINSIGDIVPANTPVIVKGAPDTKVTVAVLPEYTETPAIKTNLLSGNTIKLHNMPKRYLLATATGSMSLKNTAESTANSAYIEAERFELTAADIPFEIGASGIEDLTVGPQRPELLPGDMIFDYSGRRVNNPVPGIYINATTGKPVMIR